LPFTGKDAFSHKFLQLTERSTKFEHVKSISCIIGDGE
jgi:hypothetical protein